MERIRLNRQEKSVMRRLSENKSDTLTEYDISSICTLENKGLVKAAHIEGGGIENAILTSHGREYIHYNPNLTNPIDWAKISAIAAIMGTIAAFIALFIACTR